MDFGKYNIILASKSPRRKQLLEKAGFNFEIKTKEVEESYPDDLAVEEVAAYLARKKAHACRDFLSDGKILLAADSVVVLEDKIFGKPKDYADAFKILTALSGKVHQVYTGVCLLSQEKEHVFSGISEVHFYDLTAEEIEYYIKKFEPYDKAGAYAIQEWIGWCKIKKIEGTYSNIMGLPLAQVYEELKQF